MAVLVAGAGPAGLALAAGLAGHGVPCRVVDAAPGPGAGTRCPNLWPRTQQALDRLGVDMAELRSRSLPFTAKVWQPFDRPIRVDIRDDEGPWRTPVTLPQEILTGLLLRRLTELGVAVEWETRLTTLDCLESWVVGADGADSFVRGAAGIGWDVTAFDDVSWTQLDVTVCAPESLDPQAEYVYHAAGVHVGLVPLPGGRHRLFAARPGTGGPETAESLTVLLREMTGQDYTLTGHGRPWSVRPRAGLAAAFRAGRVLLLGEAARVFPLPVQAMNTGIQDAQNVAWKLAAVVAGRAGPELLDTYERERRPVAQALINRTGWLLTSSLEPESVELFREGYAARGGRPLIRHEPDVRYDGGLLLGPCAPGGPDVGAPLPDAPVTRSDGSATSLLRLLDPYSWALLAAEPPARMPDHLPGVRLHLFAPPGATPGPGRLGDPSGAVRAMLGGHLALVRPDGFVGCTVPLDDPGSLERYLGRLLGGSHVS